MKDDFLHSHSDTIVNSHHHENIGASRKTRLLVVIPYFYPRIGGAENYAYHIAQLFQESGSYDVTVVTSNYETNEYRKETIDGLQVHRLPASLHISNTPVNHSWYREFSRIYDAVNPDIVNIHTPVPFMGDVAALALKRRCPLVVTYHAGSMLKGKMPEDIVISVYEKFFLPMLFRRADAVVPVSEYFFSSGLGKGFEEKMHVIRPGVDISRYIPTPLPSPARTITYVGRIEHSSNWKGIEELFQAMKLVLLRRPDAILEMIGGGDALAYVKSRARDLGIGESVVFFGPQAGKDVIDAYRRSNVFVLPSTSEAEQSSISLVEAMASGRPVIGTRVGGTPYILKHEENGLLVEPKDSVALADAIVRILEDVSLAERLAKGARADAEDVDWSSQIRKYRHLFNSLLGV
ncbi:MAG: glycosyltransferase family 4 protein [Candidatus Yonathbacteria bacterium]|nr:glycosyltransferase family 4 protein [Candidatus Yonathbacteria bacterium]